MGEFYEMKKSLRKVLEQLGLRRWYMAKPVVLVHLIPKVEGGYTNVELRAFREAMLAAGVGEVYLLIDHPPLTAHERGLQAGARPTSAMTIKGPCRRARSLAPLSARPWTPLISRLGAPMSLPRDCY